MKILIIGEFSSFSKNLALGFRQLGHETFVFSWGDGYKKIEQENSYHIKTYSQGRKNIFSKFKSIFNQLVENHRLRKFTDRLSKNGKYDIVLIINPGFIKYGWKFWRALFTKKMILNLCNNPNQIYLSGCGGDIPYYHYWKKYKCKNIYLINLHFKRVVNKAGINKLNYINSFTHKVIPVMYDYSQAWRNCDIVQNWIVLPTIPLPIDLSDIKVINEKNDKIVIFHGIIRSKDKGTPYIIEAMDRIQKEYKDRVICVANGGMPLEEYKKILANTNISIDQVYAFSTGMNGLYSLAMGKVLLSGNEPENMKEFNYNDIPTINIGPDSDMIYNKLKYIIENPDIIPELSRKGREYIEKVHEAKIVAQKYIDIFNIYKDK